MPNPLQTNPLDERHVPTAPVRNDEEGPVLPWVVELRVVGTPYIIPAPVERGCIIGRGDASAGFVPDIDLTDYGAQAKGVSRRHAQMTAANNRLTLCDLGSANGTYINGKRAEPMVDYRLRHGDIVALGQLELQVNFVVQPLSDERTRHDVSGLPGIERFASGQHLLIVDENLDAARVVGFCARQSGFRTTVVNSLQEAIAAIDRGLPDALITELLFDTGHGLDLIRYLREKADSRRVPVMVITTTATGYTAGQALQQGADLFVGKPLAADVLLKTLRDLVKLLPSST